MSETPTLNVNLAPCAIWCPRKVGDAATEHAENCPGTPVPVPIPCPIPRSVVFEVRLGECYLFGSPLMCSLGDGEHRVGCPARPIRVACSIGGTTWAESHVSDCEPAGGIRAWLSNEEEARAIAACRERWALVKALVLGKSPAPTDQEGLLVSAHYNGMVGTHNAVYAALAEMARSEEAAVSAQRSLAAHRLQARRPVHQVRPEDRPSADYLAAYVERLIEEAGRHG